MGTNQGKRHDHEVAVAHTSFMGNNLTGTHRSKSLTVGICPKALALAATQKGRRAREFGYGGDGRGRSGSWRADLCLGDVTQQMQNLWVREL